MLEGYKFIFLHKKQTKEERFFPGVASYSQFDSYATYILVIRFIITELKFILKIN